jgi:hypothetical protein
MQTDESAQHEAEHKAASLHRLGWQEGSGAAIWARVVADELEHHESARETFGLNPNREAWDRLHGTALMLIVAINQVLTFEERVRGITRDAELAKARARFDGVASRAEAIRDIATHLDAYAVGLGDRQIGRGRKAAPPVGDKYVTPLLYWSNGGGTIIRLADEQLDLRTAANAAVTLSETVERVRMKYLDRAEQEANVALRRRWNLDA